MLLAAALVLHGIAIFRAVARPDGLDLSLVNALSLVAGLAVLVAWLTGVMRTLPGVTAVVLPVAAACVLLPPLAASPHRIPYADEPWAAIHIGVALVGYAFLVVVALQALVMTGLEKRLHRGLPDAAAGASPPLLTLERYLFRLITAGFVLLTLTLVSGILFSEQTFRQAGRVHAQERVFGCRLARVRHPALRPLAPWLAGSHGAKMDPRWYAAARAGIPGQQVRARDPVAPIDPAAPIDTATALGRHPLRLPRSRAGRPAGRVGFLLDRRDGDDGGEPLPPEAPGATRRPRRAARAVAARADRQAARGHPARQQPDQRGGGDAGQRDHRAPVRRGPVAAGAGDRRRDLPDPGVLRDHAEGRRCRLCRPARAAGQLRADADAAGGSARSSGSSTCSCRAC